MRGYTRGTLLQLCCVIRDCESSRFNAFTCPVCVCVFLRQLFGQACFNPCIWLWEEVAPTSVNNGTYTYVLSQPLPPSGWRGEAGNRCVVVVCRQCTGKQLGTIALSVLMVVAVPVVVQRSSVSCGSPVPQRPLHTS